MSPACVNGYPNKAILAIDVSQMPLERLPSFEEWNECCTDELALFADELDVVLGDSGSKESVGDTDAETSGPQKPSGGESSPVEEDVVEEHKEIHSQELEVQDDEIVGQKARPIIDDCWVLRDSLPLPVPNASACSSLGCM